MAALLHVAVEGAIDEAVVRRILQEVSAQVVAVYGKKGKHQLDASLRGYNNAARNHPWVVLRDLDHDAECAPELIDQLLPAPSSLMCFRIAVRTAESWILADRERVSRFLGVPAGKIPSDPDRLDDPKTELINLARRSRFKGIVGDLVPAQGTSARVGPLYTARVMEFVSEQWRPARAAKASDSLRRHLHAVKRLAATTNGS